MKMGFRNSPGVLRIKSKFYLEDQLGKFIDLTGQRFGRLVVIDFDHKEIKSGNYRSYWKCICD
jgi:hypothetical protein